MASSFTRGLVLGIGTKTFSLYAGLGKLKKKKKSCFFPEQMFESVGLFCLFCRWGKFPHTPLFEIPVYIHPNVLVHISHANVLLSRGVSDLTHLVHVRAFLSIQISVCVCIHMPVRDIQIYKYKYIYINIYRRREKFSPCVSVDGLEDCGGGKEAVREELRCHTAPCVRTPGQIYGEISTDRRNASCTGHATLTDTEGEALQGLSASYDASNKVTSLAAALCLALFYR